MSKIFIIGGPGSGKSTLARFLANKNNLNYCELDELFWDNNNGTAYNTKRDANIRDSMLSDILKKDNWIIEGVWFKEWINPIIEQADEIIILRPPYILRQYRILKRSLRRFLYLEGKTHKESLKSIYNLLIWSKSYETELLPQFINKLDMMKKSYNIIDNKNPTY